MRWQGTLTAAKVRVLHTGKIAIFAVPGIVADVEGFNRFSKLSAWTLVL